MKTKYTAGPVPEAAIKYLKAKKLKTSFNYYEVWKEEHHTAFTAAKVMELDILSDVQESLIDALNEGIPFEKWQREIRSTMDKSGWSDYHKDTPVKRRLDIIYDTNIRVSQIVGQWDRIEETKDTAPYLLYQLGTAAKHRDEHAAWEGTLLPVDDPWWDDHMPLNGWNCFTPGTLVSGEFVGGSKAFYSGEIVKITFENRSTISVTINHPIATNRGFTKAGNIKVGDQCICNISEVKLIRNFGLPHSPRRAIQDNNAPARIEDVFDSLAAQGKRTLKVSPLDFNGDAQGFKGKVYGVGSYIKLMNKVRSFCLFKIFSKNFFSRSNLRLLFKSCFCGKNFFRFRFGSTSSSNPSGGALFDSLLSVHYRPSLSHNFGAISYRYPILDKESSHSKTSDGKLFGKLFDMNPGIIQFNNVIAVTRYPFSGHVYDLQSKSGYLWANSILASNCKCWVLQVSKPRAERLGGVTPRPEQNELVEWKNKYTGKTEKIEKGIGPGWDTNLGKTRNKVYEQSVKNAKIKNDYYKKELSKAIKKKK